MWQDLVAMGVPTADKIIRTVAVYLVLAVLLRIMGKRDLAQLDSFDLVVMLLLSNVVQNAIIGPDNSLLGGLLGAVVLLAFNAVVVRLAAVDKFSRFFQGKPAVLGTDGRYDLRVLRRLGLRPEDVDVAIQRQGGGGVADTEKVTLEAGGALLVRLRPEEQAATRADIEAIRRQLDAIERRLS